MGYSVTVREQIRRLCPITAPQTTIRRNTKFHPLSLCHRPSSPSEERRNNSMQMNSNSISSHIQAQSTLVVFFYLFAFNRFTFRVDTLSGMSVTPPRLCMSARWLDDNDLISRSWLVYVVIVTSRIMYSELEVTECSYRQQFALFQLVHAYFNLL